jgi:dihydroorotate dehydrogenase
MSRAPGSWYEHLLRPLLFRMEPEAAHHFALHVLRRAPLIPGGLALLRSFGPPPQPRTVFGLTFPNPIGLAAGFDKNGVAIPAWEALGFGFVEIGTVTAQAQPGNPRPRIFRYAPQAALINRLGFNNEGADAVAARLRKLRDSSMRPSIPIGINLGKSRVTPLEDAPADYLYSFRQLHPVADYLVLNVSSPNTPGLRTLQEEAALNALLRLVTDENARLPTPKPLLLKIAPDLPDSALEGIVEAVEKFGLAGLIATNTTVDHSALTGAVAQVGGLSGAPLRARSTAVVRLLRSRTQLPIIGVGGISDPESAREKFEAGAQLLQVYTGMIYRGPNLLREIAETEP